MATIANPLSKATPLALRGFAALDDRLAEGRAGIVHARVTRGAMSAVLGHAARRAQLSGAFVLRARAQAGAALWREIAAQLGIAGVDEDPTRCAEQITSAMSSRRAALVAPMPPEGSWDRAVLNEIARCPRSLFVIVNDAREVNADAFEEFYDVVAQLDASDKLRWMSAVAEEANALLPTSDLPQLESWWSTVKRVGSPRGVVIAELSDDARHLLLLLALVARAWPVARLDMLGKSAAIESLVKIGAAITERGWATVDGAWAEAADALAVEATDEQLSRSANALIKGPFETDPWAQARAAELLLATGAHAAADETHAKAVALATEPAARREIAGRWFDEVARRPTEDQLDLRMRATQRALSAGESDEAYRWAQSASVLAKDDARVLMLLGRASVGVGDLVAAKVALTRSRDVAKGEARAEIVAELAEVAYQAGDLGTARGAAEEALRSQGSAITALRARNTLGKILLSEARWDDADSHFAEDTWAAAAAGDSTGQLRARLNRGIAVLSKGLADEAQVIFESVLREGEGAGDIRAQAFALDNLAVIGIRRHAFMNALSLLERTLNLRKRLGDRIRTARVLANLGELRIKLGLYEYADHALVFGRRALGPGMPASRASHFAMVAARIALARGNTIEARREIAAAIVDGEAAGDREFLGEAYRVCARIALEDGDVARANEAIFRAESLGTKDDALAEVALLRAFAARAAGGGDIELAQKALVLSRAAGDEDLLRDSHALLARLHAADGHTDEARSHCARAIAVRDQVADGLAGEVRMAFLAKPDVAALSKLQASLAEPLAEDEEAPRTQRSSTRPPSATRRELVGDDPAIRGLLAAIRKVARANSTVLIHGESGTGKELVAEALHYASDRANGPLVSVNCAALVETLLLSELFGHEKGAFTGAAARRRGRFELAEGGTLFLDEIGDISARTQVALLRVLQERTFERVGGTTAIRANVRIICATHRDLKAMVDRGEFREDLYYRLRGIMLEVPALRARIGDLPRIADQLLARIAEERCEVQKMLAPDAIELLSRHKWAGNVRELENVLRAASLFAEGAAISASDLIDNVDELRAVAQASTAERSTLSLRPSIGSNMGSAVPVPAESGEEFIAGGVEDDDDSGALPTNESNATAVAYAQVRQGAVSLSDMKRQIERDCIARALAETKGNITKAAALLGMKRPRLSQLVKQYGLSAVSSEVL